MASTAATAALKLPDRQVNISVQRFFEVSLLLMLATGFLTVATTGKLDMVSIVGLLGALIIKLWSHARAKDYSLSPKTVSRISFLYIAFYGLDFLVFSAGPAAMDRMLTASVHFVLFLAIMKIFSARTYLDYGELAALSFLMMLASSVLTVGSTFLGFFVLYVLFSISTFISYEIKRSMESAERAPEGPFRGAEQNRHAIEKALGSAAVGLALGIVVLASLLFFVIPRYRASYLSGLSMQSQNITGFTESVNLGDIRKILQSPLVVMRVMPEGNLSAYTGIKWRGVSLNSFDGKHWFNDNTEQFPLAAVGAGQFELPPVDGYSRRPHRQLRYHIVRPALSTDVLFAAAEARAITGSLRLVSLDETGSLHSPQHANTPFAYDVISDVGLPSAAELRHASGTLPEALRLVYLRLPRRDPRVGELARTLTSSARNNYDRVLTIQNYLRDNFRYTLDPSAIQPSDPVGSFLFQSKAGYCEYFAAAMAVMVRTLRIPARLVNGFQTGSYNSIGHDLVVRARDAHSWVEVYFPQYGWIPFDPTPADPHPTLPGAWDDYLDAAALFWNEWIINYDFSHQVRLAREVEQDSRDFQQVFRARTNRLKRRGIRAAFFVEAWLIAHKLLVLALMAGAVGLLILSEKRRSLAELRFLMAWRFARQDAALGAREASLAYDRLLQVLRKKGYRKKPSQTPREFALSFVTTPWGAAVMEFTRLYNLLRFGRERVALECLRRILEDIRT